MCLCLLLFVTTSWTMCFENFYGHFEAVLREWQCGHCVQHMYVLLFSCEFPLRDRLSNVFGKIYENNWMFPVFRNYILEIYNVDAYCARYEYIAMECHWNTTNTQWLSMTHCMISLATRIGWFKMPHFHRRDSTLLHPIQSGVFIIHALAFFPTTTSE